MREYLKYSGIKKKIIIVASPNVQENFKTQLFDQRKLTKTEKGWELTGCSGDKLLTDINISQLGNISKEKIVERIKKMIKKYYIFIGYTKFANYIQHVSKIPDSIKNKKKAIYNKLNKEFSESLIVIDEVHNIRPSSSNREAKYVSSELSRLVENVKKIKLLFLSATPMYNDSSEIIYLLNILNTNDNRSTISNSDIFDKENNLKISSSGEEIGKKILQKKSIGYVSYVRGENPYVFPYRIFPKLFDLSKTYEDPLNQKPTTQFNGMPILQNLQFIDIFLNKLDSYQEYVYQLLINNIKDGFNDEDMTKYEEASTFGYTVLQPPIHALNIVYPNKQISESSTIPEGFNLKLLYGKEGLDEIMSYSISKNPQRKNKFDYKTKEFGKIFSQEEIGKYSSKLKHISESIINSEGIILIYSQYIDAGLIPVALTLEEMGISRYGDKSKSLLKNPPSMKMDALSMTLQQNVTKQAKYAMITGDKLLSPKNNDEVIALTNSDNINGEKIKVVLISSAGSEGLDFSNIRQVHVLEPWYNMNRIEQIIGRAIRNCSHKNLPFSKRNVQIFLHGTILTQQEQEAIDIYLYRYAENKAVKIGQINRALKENAIDCLLNIEQTNFSAEKMKITLKQNLSNKKEIDYTVGDKPFTSICDYMDSCHFSCSGKKSEIVDNSTYSEIFASNRLNIIINIIKQLMYDKFVYTKQEIIEHVQYFKPFTIEEINLALHKLTSTPFMYIHDKYNRRGNLVNIKDYYIFQPIELTNSKISMNDRTVPFTEKVKDITYNVDKNVKKNKQNIQSRNDDLIREIQEMYDSCIDNTNKIELPDNYKILKKTKEIVMSNGISNEQYNKYVMHYMIERLKIEDCVQILNYIYNESLSSFYTMVKEYFDSILIKTDKYTGIVLIHNKAIELYVFEENAWIVAKDTAKRALALDILKFKSNVDDLGMIIGYIGICSKNSLDFKLKIKASIMQELKANKKKLSTGFKIKDVSKSELIQYINDALGYTKYIKNSDEDNTKSISTLLLGAELEFILRWKNDTSEQIWFQKPFVGIL